MISRKPQLLRCLLVVLLLQGGGVPFAARPPKAAQEGERRGMGKPPYGTRTTNTWSGSKFRFPTEFLRDLIHASPAEQEKLLAEKAERDRKFFESYYRNSKSMTEEEIRERVQKRLEDSRQFWAAKIKEYAALTPEQREMRIENTHRTVMLREHLKPLMKASPLERADRLREVPDADRALLESRLKIWDALPSEVQKLVLEHDSALHYFARYETSPAEQREAYMNMLPSSVRRRLEEDILEWNDVPAARRDVMKQAFASLFTLSDEDQEKALTYLPEAERRKLEEALDQFGDLTPAQREKCIQAYQKFLGLSPVGRQQFMSNAEVWKQMDEGERNAWRALVSKLPPQNVSPAPAAQVPESLKTPPPVPSAKPKR